MVIATAVLLGIAAIMASVGGIASLWAMNRGVGWLARAAPIVVVPATLLPMGMADIAVLGWLQGISICAGVWACRRIRAWRLSKPSENDSGGAEESASEFQPAVRRFRLADLLIAVVLAATVFGFASYSPDAWEIASWSVADYFSCLIAGMVLAGLTLAGWWIVISARRWAWLGYGVLVVIATLSAIADPQVVQTFAVCAVLFGGSLQILLTSLWLRLLAGSGWDWWSPQKSASCEKISGEAPATFGNRRAHSLAARISLSIFSIICMIPLVDLYWALLPPSASNITLPAPNESVPNGYVDLVAAGHQLKWNAFSGGDPDAANLQQLEQFVAENSNALSSARRALSVPSQVPLDSPTRSAVVNTDFQSLRDLCRACLVEAKVHRQNGRPNDAVDSYLDALRLSVSTSRGGEVIDELVAAAIESTTLDSLANTLSSLDEQALEKTIRECQSILSNREPLADILQRDKPTPVVASNWMGRVELWLFNRGLMESAFVADVEVPKIRTRRDARLNLLILEAALRRYELANGKSADKLADLVPAILKRVPLDPLNGKPFVYRKTDSGHLLYSVGDNGIDDGGVRPTNHDHDTGDLLLAPPL